MTEPKRCPQCQADLPPDAPMGLCPKCVLKVGVESRQGTQGEEGSARAAFVPPEPAELAEHFPQLEVMELLGQGGMGAVYKARQPSLDRLVALKILRPNLGDDPAFAERFAREARSLARLNHPNIVGVYDFGQAGGFFYFLMEYVDGVNLREMAGREPMAPKEALAIVPQICDALQYAHDEGIVHRDIKPENILIDTKGRVKIADFGLAKLLGRRPTDVTLTQPQQVMGTPHYMAPEQIETPAAVDQRADIYSLGVVFYELLTGELPIGRFAPPSQKVQVDVRLDEVVLKTLQKEPERRYQQASEVKTDVESIATGPPVGAPPPAHQADAPQPADVEAARQRVRGPATGLLVVGILDCLLIGLLVILPIFFYHFYQGTREAVRDLSAPSVVPVRGQGASGSTFVPSAALSRFSLQGGESSAEARGQGFSSSLALPGFVMIFILVLVMYIPITILIILGAVKMRKLESYGLATVGSIAAMLPCTPAFLIGLPIGIWALWALTRPEVKAAFAHKRGRRGGTGGAAVFHAAAPASPAEQQAGPAPVQKQTGETDTGVKIEQTSKAGKSKIGIISLILAIGGALVTLVIVWSDGEPLYSLCLFLFIALEISALVTGIIGWRSACGKAGLIISAILLVLATILALMAVSPSRGPSGVRMEYEVTMDRPGSEVADTLRSPATKPATQAAKYLTLDVGKGVTMKLLLIPAGKFTMGSPKTEKGRSDDEGPQRMVTISPGAPGFYMGVCEVTSEQYEAVIGKKPSMFKGPKNPAEHMFWHEAVAFCKALSKKTGKTVRLPTEAEWEYAYRAGTKTVFCFGDDDKQLGDYAWYAGNSGSNPQPVAQKKPNAWGLYDMHGNVTEWCSDWYADSYANAKVVDPQGAASGNTRVGRGGCWTYPPQTCRSANRDGFTPDNRSNGYIGFRVVVEVD